MALADYRQCDVCAGKSFYDARLNYDWDEETLKHTLYGLGDWVVICPECAKTHKCIVVPRESPPTVSGND